MRTRLSKLTLEQTTLGFLPDTASKCQMSSRLRVLWPQRDLVGSFLEVADLVPSRDVVPIPSVLGTSVEILFRAVIGLLLPLLLISEKTPQLSPDLPGLSQLESPSPTKILHT